MATARLTALAATLLAGSAAHAGGPIIDIPPASLPTAAWFASNPNATVNVSSGETIFPDSGGGTFGFNGATVNIETTASSGFFTVDQFLEDVTYNINGGKLLRAKFIGSVGETTLNINSGSVERGLHLRGNSTGTMSGGDMGLVAGGQAAMVLEDDASFVMSGGTIDTFILLIDSSVFSMSAGTLEGALLLEDEASAVVSGGSTGRDGRLRDVGNALTVTGGTIGRDFLVEHGTVTMSGGAFDENSAMLNSGGVDPVWNMSGGALGSDFRLYDGTMNVSGGLIGDGFRLGRPTGDGSGATLNLTVKSATIDGVDVPMTYGVPSVITVRGGAFLSAVLMDDSLVGLDLNEDSVFGEDRVRAAAVLTVTLGVCPADVNADGVVNFFDIADFITLYLAMDPAADIAAPFGAWDFFDVSAYLASFSAGCP
tara:strand:- start:18636 stop:19913 length:1278 start_codon:yes stop_codon:yes gene_type:complete